jgi:O-antigen ligase
MPVKIILRYFNWESVVGLLAICAVLAISYLISQIQNPLKIIIFLAGIIVLILSFIRIDWCFLALVFITYTNLSEVMIEYHSMPSVAKLYVVILLLFIMLRWILYGEQPGGNLVIFLILILYIASISITLLYANESSRALHVIITYAKEVVIALVAIMIITRGVILRQVVWSLLIAGLFLSTISVHQHITGSFWSNYWGFGRADYQQIVGETDSFRLTGPLADANFYGMVLLCLVPLSFERLKTEKNCFLRFIAACTLATSTLTIIFTYSRGALLALLVMLFMIVAHLRHHMKMLLLFLTISIILLPLLPTMYMDRLSTISQSIPVTSIDDSDAGEDMSINGRLSEMAVAWNIFLDHPILGIGAGNFPTYFQQYSLKLGLMNRGEAREAHSLYLQIAAERGLSGLFTFAILLLLIIHSIKLSKSVFLQAGKFEFRDISWAFGVAFVGYLVASLFLHDGYPRYFWLLVGIVLAMPQAAKWELRQELGL